MTRWKQGLSIILGSIAATVLVLAGALAWGPHHCKLAFPMVIGCAVGSYESLAGGMFAASAALFAGWLAWSGVQVLQKNVGLPRLRGFALENADFTIFWLAKYLICKERGLPFWLKTAVVKTYPIPKRS